MGLLTGKNDTIRLSVAVFAEVPDIRSGNVSELGEGVDESNGDGSLGGWTGKRGRDPRVEDDEAGVRTGLEEQGDVSGSNVERRHANNKADQTDTDGSDNVPEL